MAAFERVVAMGCVEVETDVCFAKDGRLLLLHDDTLDRTTDGSGRPEDFTLDELERLDAGSLTDERLSRDRDYSGENPITLEERLDAFGTALTYHVEIKNPTPGLVPATIAAVAERGLLDRVFIAAVDDDAPLQEAMRLAPVIRVACPSRCPPTARARSERCAANGYAMVTLNASNQSRELVELAHSLGMEARSSGIATRERMIAATEIGCNGMTINWPDWLMDHVREPRATLLSRRLKELEAAGILAKVADAAGPGPDEYRLTEAGLALAPVIEAIGTWGQGWVATDVSLANPDPALLMWDMRRNLDPDPMPDGRKVVRFGYPDQPASSRDWWLIVEPDGGVDLCASEPGFDVDLYVTSDLRVMVSIWMGLSTVSREIDASRLHLDGPAPMRNRMQAWLGLSRFAGLPKRRGASVRP